MHTTEVATSNQEGPRPSLTRLFLAFLGLGATALGGPAMVAYIRKLVVQKKRWLDEEAFRNGVALCQVIPGATAMQTCAYVGLRLGGVRGAAVSFIGFGLPAFLLMLVLSTLYVRYHNLPIVVASFDGLRALIVALIAHSAVTFGKSYLKKWQDFFIVPFAAALFWFGLSPIVVVLGSAILGVALSFRRDRTQHRVKIESKPFTLIPYLIIVSAAVVYLLALFFINSDLFNLSLLMMMIDLFAFGGGFASIPLMLHEVVDVRHWMDSKTFMDGIALGQVTPGPVVITSTFVGYVLQGPLGAIIATASIFLPSFVMVIVTAPFFATFKEFPLFRKAIDGVLCSFVGLLLSVAVRLAFVVAWDFPHLALACVAFIVLFLRVDLIWVVLGGIGISILLR